ncbi:SDR family NAD(P)-dependent oxidoreductase [Couchioplanes azureus]|uniref:SDR family NAD(P)-dependent oxidoreductase n=1 Tax=Couchioplanes caeruleus TaxID=56438 RepID=UPI0016708A0F|nr:SDR family oxidoreductase [Couchioplanes caeruleus]GGQ67944.1 beta-ketoacyl-ACP reductase [Couchioplanes caeruleus subsp. azureus]
MGDLVALVTGGSRGIGRAISRKLAGTGMTVAVNYRSDRAAAAELVEAIVAGGGAASAHRADVRGPEGVGALVRQVEDAYGHIDVLVSNVGEFSLSAVAATSDQLWHDVLESNLGSAFYACKAVLPGMRRRGFGRIVTIGLSPVHQVRGAPNLAPYAIAKTGVVILTKSLAVEEAARGITVNCVSPGLIDNGFLPPEQEEWMRKRVPSGRLGRPEEVADAVEFLVSERAGYISGANLAVSGAWDWEDRPTGHDAEVTGLFPGSAS